MLHTPEMLVVWLTQLSLCFAFQAFPGKSSGSLSNDVSAKKPPVDYSTVDVRKFKDTPFANWDNFSNSVISDSAGVTFGQINDLDTQMAPELKQLTQENFFRIFRLNLFKQCPFWSGDSGFCTHRSCAVDTIDDWKDLPEIWQPEALGAISNASRVTKNDSDYKDYCELDQVDDDTVYVDLIENPERFTGYGGDQSFQVWKSIYSENCFNLGHDQCTEKNFFYRLISGMHGSISTHLSHGFLDLKTKTYGPNLQQFMFRVGNFPDRIENIYLNYILVLKALIKLESLGILDSMHYGSSNGTELKAELAELIRPSYKIGDNTEHCLFDENQLFQSEDAAEIKDEFKVNFRNVSTLMDCVQCDRCRLWGKIETTGYGTALKVLFDLQDTENLKPSDYNISNIELVALVNTFDVLSDSVEDIKDFKMMYDEAIRQAEENNHTSSESDEPAITMSIKDVNEKEDVDFTNPDVFKESEKQNAADPGDIIYPTRKNKPSLMKIFKTELKNVEDAVVFIFHSYFVFPKIVYNWCLIRMVYYWNKFVGHVQEDFDVERLYHEEL